MSNFTKSTRAEVSVPQHLGMGDYYDNARSDTLYVPGNIGFTHFRFFFDGRAMKIKDRIHTKEELLIHLRKWYPTDVFYTPSKFLNPTAISKKSDKISQNLFLYADEFVIDLDFENMSRSKEAVLHLLSYLYSVNWMPNYTCFSGSKGWHVSLPFQFRSSSDSPITRELETRQVKSSIIQSIVEDTGLPTLKETGEGIDTIVSWDTRRIVRLPGTIHGKTGNLCEIVEIKDIERYTPKHLVDVQKPVELRKLI